jgi:hypothetical protein
VYAALLGVQPQADAPYYVGFDAAGQQIGLVPAGGQEGMTSPVAYWHVADIEANAGRGDGRAGATVKGSAARRRRAAAWWPPSPTPDGNVLAARSRDPVTTVYVAGWPGRSPARCASTAR